MMISKNSKRNISISILLLAFSSSLCYATSSQHTLSPNTIIVATASNVPISRSNDFNSVQATLTCSVTAAHSSKPMNITLMSASFSVDCGITQQVNPSLPTVANSFTAQAQVMNREVCPGPGTYTATFLNSSAKNVIINCIASGDSSSFSWGPLSQHHHTLKPGAHNS